MHVTEVWQKIKPFVLGAIDRVLSAGSRNLGTPSTPFGTIYTNAIQADEVFGTMAGQRWEYGGDMQINPNAANASTTLSIINTEPGGMAHLSVEGNISVGGTVDGVDISAHASDPDAHHAALVALRDASGNYATPDAADTVRIVGGDGVLSAASGNQISLSVDSTVVRTSRQVVAGAGLLGGGNLATDRTFSVNVGDGLAITSGAVSLLTPGTLSVSSTNNAAGNHTHAITSSSNPGAAASILATDSSGYLTLVRLTATDRLRTSLIDSAGGANMTLQPAQELLLAPDANIVRLASGRVLQSSSYVSQTTGMRITDAGEGDFRYLFADELHAKSFIADLEQALAGGQIIAKSVAVVATDFTLPTAGNSATLRVRDLPSAPNMAVFQTGDFVGLRQFSRSGGALSVAWAWGTVSGYADGTGANEGTQTWTFTRHSGTPGTASGVIPADSLVLDFGVSGNGFYEVNAIDGVYGQNSPYAQVVTWSGHPATQTVRARFGNLRGITGTSGEFGLFAGSGTSVTDRYIRASSTAVEIRNVPLALFDGTNNTLLLSAGSGNNAPHLAMGSPLPSSPTAGAGLWMGLSGGAYHFRVGDPTGQRLHWDGSSLTVVGSVTIQGGSGYNNLSDRPTSLYAVNPAEHAQLVTGRKVFVETFDDPNSITQWESFSGSGEMNILSTAAASAGGRILRIGDNAGNDQRWLIHRRLIPYKANTLYKMTVRIRRTAGSGRVYVGMAGVAADGTTWVNTAGNNTATSSQHYFVASNVNPPTAFTIYTGFLLGWGSPNGGVSGGFYRAHADVRYIRPLIIVNYPNAAGTTDIDFVEIEEYNYPGSAGLYLTPLFAGYHDGTSWRSYFDNNGNFAFGASGNAGIFFTAATNRLEGRDSSGIAQWYASGDDGRLYAGGGVVILDNSGIRIKSSQGGYYDINAYQITDYAGNVVLGGLYGYEGSSNSGQFVRLYVQNTNRPANLILESTTNDVIYASNIELIAKSGNQSSTVIIDNLSGTKIYSDLTVYGNTSTFFNSLLAAGTVGYSWTNLTLATGWSNNGSGWATAQYAQFGDWVMLKGLVQATQNHAAFATILTLPSAVRPAENRMFATGVGSSAARLDVLSNGTVRVGTAVNNGDIVSIECIYKR
ncbi:MAG: hypothetical protein KatS3mg038_1561 [Candidatus Kapaibacterium sp.]|nr:MAG: hypothetical protein KatS3mg038_1561 [Candidatus Kapabacteria bacterium]